MIISTIRTNTKSHTHIKAPSSSIDEITRIAEVVSSSRVDHETLPNSVLTSRKKIATLFAILFYLISAEGYLPRNHPSHEGGWQARRDSNPQQAVLETAALPIGATGLPVYRPPT